MMILPTISLRPMVGISKSSKIRINKRNFKRVLFGLGILITILVGILTGIILVYQHGFPQIENLEDVPFKVMSVIYDDSGTPIKEFAAEKRIIINRQQIPLILENALIASEDKEFYTHWGINFRGTLRAVMGVISGRNLGGGSSITQQLARNFFLTNERTFSRKFKEILLAIQIEKKYSKDQILTAYCNKIYLGHGVYGVEAAARYYFGKSVNEIVIAEAALLAAILPGPNNTYNLFKNPGNCLRKRNFILETMLDKNMITHPQFQEAMAVPLPTEPFPLERQHIGDYYMEEIRKQLVTRLGNQSLYSGGLKIYSTLNTRMQQWAEEALKQGLRDLDKRRGWRGQLKNDPEANLKDWEDLSIEEGQLVTGIILSVNNFRATVKIAHHRGRLAAGDAQWTGLPLTMMLKPGDIILCKILKIPTPPYLTLTLALEQEPELEGALLVIENKSGQIKAMVGGYSFERSQWNHATQALRQPGSTIKPIIYSAALKHSYSPATLIMDEPVIFDNRWTGTPYQPRNDSRDFIGPVTLRTAFEQSRNIISAKIVDRLTPPVILRYARRFGITSPLAPTMSLALGAYEVTLSDMVAAYTVFPNLGTRVTPYFIRKILHQNGYTLEESYSEKQKVLDENTAYVINYMMQGVMKYGTGRGIFQKTLPPGIGGKTGTTNNYTDAWFIGFSPSVTVGVWVGFQQKIPLGPGESGAKAAGPIFASFMKTYLQHYKEPRDYRRPPGVTMVKIDKQTGKLFSPDCKHSFFEMFVRGTEPDEFCKHQ